MDKPLTDAELEWLDAEVWADALGLNRAETLMTRAIAELRALRAQNAAMRKEWIDSLSTVYKALHREQEQNAKMVAALEEIMETDCVAGETPFQVEQRLHAIAHRAWHGALASVKGETE